MLRLGRPATSVLRCIETQSQCRTSILQSVPAVRSFHSSTRTFDKQEEASRSFRGQLYESTSDRLKRERQEQAQYIKASSERKGEPRTLALSVGMFAIWTSSIHTDLGSHFVCCRRRILAGFERRKDPRHHLNHTSRSSTTSSTRYTRLGPTSRLGRLCSDCRKRECINDTG